MKLIVGGKTKTVPDSVTVAELLELEKVETPGYVSVQVNDKFVRREDFAAFRLSESDRVELMYFMGGGRSRCG